MKKIIFLILLLSLILFGCTTRKPIVEGKVLGPNLYIASVDTECKNGQKKLFVTFESLGCSSAAGLADTHFAFKDGGTIVSSVNQPINCLTTEIIANDLECGKSYALEIIRDLNNDGILTEATISFNDNFVFEFPILEGCCSSEPTVCLSECQSNSVNLSTGFNHSTNSVYTPGDADGYWELISVPTTSGYTAPRPAFSTTPYEGWGVPNNSNSLWISGEPTSSWSTTNPTIPYIFERCFCYCEDLAGTSPQLDIMVWADDQVELSLFDGQNSTSITTVNGWSGTHVLTGFTPQLQSDKKYCLRAGLKNIGRTAMGLKIEGTVSGGVFSSPSCCESESKITGFKYHDKDCNGKFNSGDTKLEGWAIQLIDEFGNVVATSTTDVGGYYFFNEVESGTYQIKEVLQNGWTFQNPNNGVHSNVVVTPNQVFNYNFGNCEEPPNPTGCCPGENLVVNGNFNDGFNGFTTDFMPQTTISSSSILPGQVGIMNGADAIMISQTWSSVQDPSTCASSGSFLVVNGENGGGSNPSQLSNSIPPTKVIWKQTFNNMQDWKGYKFCFKAKNLDQCGFNVAPKINVKFSMPFGDFSETISVSSAPCAWQEISKHLDLWGYGNTLTITIELDQTEFGDGNDIAIDDIYLIQIPQVDASLTTFGVSNPTPIGGNEFSITFDATPLLNGCGCFWEVCEINPSTDECIPNTKVSNAQEWWSIPTYCNSFNFAGYDGDNILGSTSNAGVFDITKTYRITRGAFCKCESWNQISYDLFEKNNFLILRDTKSEKVIKQFSADKLKGN